MGYNLLNRISVLQKQADNDQRGRWGLFQAMVAGFLLFSAIALFLLPTSELAKKSIADAEKSPDLDTWFARTEGEFSERREWLSNSPFIFSTSAADSYEAYGKAVVSAFETQYKSTNPDDLPIDLDSISTWLGRMMVGALLRIGFIVIGFWPIWIVSSFLGYYALRNRFVTGKSESVLGVCDRGNGPFYSGIYGPLRSNKSISCIDYSAPSLACPRLETKSKAANHKLTLLLREYKAYNETNLGLVRIILAHSDYPSLVGDENALDEEPENPLIPPEERKSKTGFLTNEGGTIVVSSLEKLVAILEVHRKLAAYVQSLEQKGIPSGALNKNYPAHLSNLKKLSVNMSPLAKLLLTSLTPNRQWAISKISPHLLATAYLATEAGKSLVFKRHDSGYVRMSNYPHLQARAVVQSLPSYHREYDGDSRLIARQAIICSRRHGDFGRAFLPNRMPVESRSLRDWLEILYADPDKRSEAAHLVELDSYMEEIGVHWRTGLVSRLRREAEQNEKAGITDAPYKLWKGVPLKSVVLVEIDDVLAIALRGVHETKQARISQLLETTRRYQTHISISARLPGFKRQAMEAEKVGDAGDSILEALLMRPDGAKIVERWRIVRRMLTRYNWLSTRVGDDGVPLTGVVKGIILKHEIKGKPPILPFEALIPLRQRRYVEILGRQWEKFYFGGAPHPEDVEIFVNNETFEARCKELELKTTAGDSPKPDETPNDNDDLKTVASG